MSFNTDTPGAESGETSGHANASSELLGFAGRFLKLNGAVVETNKSGIDALIPEELQRALDTPEYIRISCSTVNSKENQGHYELNYGSPLLDRMVGMALHSVPLLTVNLEFDYVKNGGFDRLIKDQLTFYGALANVETTADVAVDYLYVACRYKAQSDEQKEGLLEMVFNMDTRTFVPGMSDLLDHAVCRMVFMTTPDARGASIPNAAGEHIQLHAERMLLDQLKSFQESMNRRFKRDVNNLAEYYSSLEEEMTKSLESSTLSENGRETRQSKIDALPAEFERKTDDLFKKYSIKVYVAPTAAMIIRSPAKKILCKVSVGKKIKRLFLTYNPVTRSIEPPSCSRCKKSITHIHFGNDRESLCIDCKKR